MMYWVETMMMTSSSSSSNSTYWLLEPENEELCKSGGGDNHLHKIRVPVKSQLKRSKKSPKTIAVQAGTTPTSIPTRMMMSLLKLMAFSVRRIIHLHFRMLCQLISHQLLHHLLPHLPSCPKNVFTYCHENPRYLQKIRRQNQSKK